MDKEKVLNLAKLARISINDEEAENLSHEFDAILKYVGEVKGVTINSEQISPDSLHNVMREDNNPHESGVYTKKILEQAPARDDDYIKVKKIL